jgi:hypothetical protein
MLRRSFAFAVAAVAVIAAAGLFAKIVQPGDEPKDAAALTAESRVLDSFIRDPSRVSLPKASVDSFHVGTYVEPDPIRVEGEFSGRFYGAFETSWFQPANKNEIWFLTGPQSGVLWSLWESDRTIPYGPDHPNFDPNDSRPLDEWFWPYVCVNTTVRGTWESNSPDSIYPGTIYVEKVIDAVIVDLPFEDCVPASGSAKRSR